MRPQSLTVSNGAQSCSPCSLRYLLCVCVDVNTPIALLVMMHLAIGQFKFNHTIFVWNFCMQCWCCCVRSCSYNAPYTSPIYAVYWQKWLSIFLNVWLPMRYLLNVNVQRFIWFSLRFYSAQFFHSAFLYVDLQITRSVHTLLFFMTNVVLCCPLV